MHVLPSFNPFSFFSVDHQSLQHFVKDMVILSFMVPFYSNWCLCFSFDDNVMWLLLISKATYAYVLCKPLNLWFKIYVSIFKLYTSSLKLQSIFVFSIHVICFANGFCKEYVKLHCCLSNYYKWWLVLLLWIFLVAMMLITTICMDWNFWCSQPSKGVRFNFVS